MTDKQLAERARQHADQAWLDRRAWLSVSALLESTSTPAAARKALSEIRQADVRARAAELLDQLVTDSTMHAAAQGGTAPS